MMIEDWSDCANNNIEMDETLNKAKISDRIINTIMIFHSVVVFLYGIGIILTNVDVTDRTTELSHIHKMEFPFHISTQFMYKVVLIVELMYVLMCAWGSGLINTLLLSLVSYNYTSINTNAQLFVIKYRRAYIRGRSAQIL